MLESFKEPISFWALLNSSTAEFLIPLGQKIQRVIEIAMH